MCRHPRSLSPSITASRDPIKPLPPPRVPLVALNIPPGSPQEREMPWGSQITSDHRKESSVLIFYIPFWSLGGGKEKPSIGCSSPFNNLGEHLPTSPLGKRKNLPSPHAPPPPPSPIFDRQPLEPDRFCFHCTCLQLPATHGHPDWCAACGDSVEGPF